MALAQIRSAEKLQEAQTPGGVCAKMLNLLRSNGSRHQTVLLQNTRTFGGEKSVAV